jgi:hypothetical protein
MRKSKSSSSSLSSMTSIRARDTQELSSLSVIAKWYFSEWRVKKFLTLKP